MIPTDLVLLFWLLCSIISIDGNSKFFLNVLINLSILENTEEALSDVLLCFFPFFFFSFLATHMVAYGVPGPGIRFELQVQQYQILNPLCRARDWTCVPLLPRRHGSHCATAGTPCSGLLSFHFRTAVTIHTLHTASCTRGSGGLLKECPYQCVVGKVNFQLSWLSSILPQVVKPFDTLTSSMEGTLSSHTFTKTGSQSSDLVILPIWEWVVFWWWL